MYSGSTSPFAASYYSSQPYLPNLPDANYWQAPIRQLTQNCVYRLRGRREFAMCRQANGWCTHWPRCTYAHSPEELKAWNDQLCHKRQQRNRQYRPEAFHIARPPVEPNMPRTEVNVSTATTSSLNSLVNIYPTLHPYPSSYPRETSY